MFNKFLLKIRKNKIEFILLFLILVIACFLRLYNLNDFLHFANDEARDAFVIQDFIKNGHFPLLGPETSIGHFHLGPIFYYLIAPFFLIFSLQPISGAILSMLLGIATIILIYQLLREIFNRETALISSFLYSISFIIILHSRWSWNPNLIPFFIVLYLYSFFKIVSTSIKVNSWFYILIFSLTMMLQLHASAFLLIPVTIILFAIYRPKKISWYAYLISLLILLILFTPFIYYELSHNFENCQKIINTILYEKSSDSFFHKILFNSNGIINLITALLFSDFSGLNNNFSFKDSSDFTNPYTLLGLFIFLVMIAFSCFSFIKYRNNKHKNLIYIFFLSLVFVFLISKKVLFLHYYIIFFPLIFIFAGIFISYFYQKNLPGKTSAVLIIVLLLVLNINYLVNFWTGISQGTWQKNHEITLEKLEKSIDYIAKEAKNDKINLVCNIPDYCQSFEYLLEQKNLSIDNNSDEVFKVIKSFEVNSEYKPIHLEKIN